MTIKDVLKHTWRVFIGTVVLLNIFFLTLYLEVRFKFEGIDSVLLIFVGGVIGESLVRAVYDHFFPRGCDS